MKRLLWACVISLLICAIGISCSGRMSVIPEGEKIDIFVLVDKGIRDNMLENERNDRDEVGQWMEQDLLENINDEGFNAVLITDRGTYTAGPGTYLLAVTIQDLHLVGRSARAWAGRMAGPSWVNAHYDFYNDEGKPLISYDDNEGTTDDWTESPEEMDERVLDKVREQIEEKYKQSSALREDGKKTGSNGQSN